MRIIFNNNFEISNVFKMVERVDSNFIEQISFSATYSDELFENILNFFKNIKNIDLIEVYRDEELIRQITKYNTFNGLFNRTSNGNAIELILEKKDA